MIRMASFKRMFEHEFRPQPAEHTGEAARNLRQVQRSFLVHVTE